MFLVAAAISLSIESTFPAKIKERLERASSEDTHVLKGGTRSLLPSQVKAHVALVACVLVIFKKSVSIKNRLFAEKWSTVGVFVETAFSRRL